MNYNPADVAISIAAAIETAWNNADHEAFGAQFAEFADYIDTRGEYNRGRRTITWGHKALFDSIFKGSTNKYEVLSARLLAPGVLSAQCSATLVCPVGPMAGENHATLTFIAREKDGQWLVEVFHNTLKPREISAEEQAVRDSIR